MSAPIVRRAEPRDDAAIGELLVEGYVAAYSRKMPAVVLTARRKAELRDVAKKRTEAIVLALELDGRVGGTVALWRQNAPGSEAWLPDACDLRHLAVAPSLQGRGLAGPLLDEAERIARDELQARFICLHVRRGNEGVARLYRGRGYLREPRGDLDYPEVQLDAYFLPLR